tara:strand:+ start:1674 stop:1997 length:324 start_codon:yes stop_codon:yes gene_type:complete
MIKSITKRSSRGKLEIEIETKIKDFYSHENRILTDQDVLAIAMQEHDIKEIISRPSHEVGNYIGTGTRQKGVWIFKLNPKKASTKSSLRGKISKIAKKLDEQNEQRE